MSHPGLDTPPAAAASLTVGVVVFRPDWGVLETTVATLLTAVGVAREKGLLGKVELYLIDNGSVRERWERFLATVREGASPAGVGVQVRSGHGNIGYGAGNNLALRASRAELHLVLNPDVEIEPEALAAGVRCLEAHPRAVLVAPAVVAPSGESGHLCRRYPSVIDFALRGFAPAWLQRRAQPRLSRFEMRDLAPDLPAAVPLCSGAFMLARAAALREVGGFDERYFLYFEDYDLSLRLSRKGELLFCPAMRVRHLGGGASRKGLRHLGLFAASAFRFFGRHGWRWA